MRPEIVSVVVLVLLFVAGTILPVNLGAIGFMAAFLVGVVALDLPSDEIIAGFPSDLFLLLVGVTYLFGVAQTNGTIDLLVNWTVGAVRGRAAALPWVFFFIAALLSAIGALFAVAIVAPIAMQFAARFQMSALLVGMMVVHGALAGAFSPISVYGSFINALVARSGLPSNPTVLFVSPFLMNIGIAAVVFLVLGGRDLITVAVVQRQESAGQVAPNQRDWRQRGFGSAGLEQFATILGITALVVGTAAFGLDVGFLSISIAVLLTLLAPERQKHAVDKISWSTVLLITGILTYVGVLQKAGTIDYASRAVADLGAPLFAALILCLTAGVTSAFASSAAILGVAVPLAIPFLKQGQIGAIGMVAALAVATTIVDVSPFSTNGALVLANAEAIDRDRFHRQMLVYTAIVVAFGPLLAWALLVLPGWL